MSGGAQSLAERGLGLVGAGKMAEALVRGVMGARLLAPSRIAASDPDPARRRVLSSLGVRVFERNRDVLAASGVVVLAVKPQALPAVLDDLRDAARPDHLFVSIAAGVPIAKIELRLPPSSRVVRVMPNTPMQVGKGASALARGSSARGGDLETAKSLFAASGLALEVDEKDLDAVTAVSGSGPAYAFFLAECMIEAGVAEGLAPETARRLAAATIEGAGALLEQSADDPAELRRRVTSPGGTTEAAFAVLDREGVRARMVAAVRRAAERSRELAR